MDFGLPCRGDAASPAKISSRFLIYVQFYRFDAFWTTDYGLVLSSKIAAVVALLALGAVNRYFLVPRFEAKGEAAGSGVAVQREPSQCSAYGSSSNSGSGSGVYAPTAITSSAAAAATP